MLELFPVQKLYPVMGHFVTEIDLQGVQLSVIMEALQAGIGHGLAQMVGIELL